MNRTRYVHTRRCAQCWGPVVSVGDELVCPKGCEPGGHVDAGWVEGQIANDTYEYERVAQNYPDLVPDRKRKTLTEAVSQLF